MALIDLTIGAKQDLRYYAGETFSAKLVIADKAGTHINWTGATIGSFVIFLLTSTDPSVTIDPQNITVNSDGDIEIEADNGLALARGRYNYEFPIRPAGGGPRGIINGKIIVNDRG